MVTAPPAQELGSRAGSIGALKRSGSQRAFIMECSWCTWGIFSLRWRGREHVADLVGQLAKSRGIRSVGQVTEPQSCFSSTLLAPVSRAQRSPKGDISAGCCLRHLDLWKCVPASSCRFHVIPSSVFSWGRTMDECRSCDDRTCITRVVAAGHTRVYRGIRGVMNRHHFGQAGGST